MSDGGKGSSPRPFSVDRKTFESNWDSIFRNRDSEVDKVTRYNQETQEVKQYLDSSIGRAAASKAEG